MIRAAARALPCRLCMGGQVLLGCQHMGRVVFHVHAVPCAIPALACMNVLMHHACAGSCPACSACASAPLPALFAEVALTSPCRPQFLLRRHGGILVLYCCI